MFGVVDHRERADAPGRTPRNSNSLSALPKDSLSADLVLQRFQVDLAILLRDDQKIPFLRSRR